MITTTYTTHQHHSWECPIEGCDETPYRTYNADRGIPTLYKCGHSIGAYQYRYDDDTVRDELLESNPTHLMIVGTHGGGDIELYFIAPDVPDTYVYTAGKIVIQHTYGCDCPFCNGAGISHGVQVTNKKGQFVDVVYAPSHAMALNNARIEYPNPSKPISNILDVTIIIDSLIEYDGMVIKVIRRTPDGTVRYQSFSPNSESRVEACFEFINRLASGGHLPTPTLFEADGSVHIAYHVKESK